MKIIKKSSKHIDNDALLACYDVGKETLSFHCSYNINNEDIIASDWIDNRPGHLQHHFSQLEQLKEQSGKKRIVIICEPSGGYEHQLLNAAWSNSYTTRYVSGEATKKASAIESNDNEKSDEKDPRTIDLVAKLKRTLTCECRKGQYKKLEELNKIYEDESLQGAQVKNHISSCLNVLFSNYSRKLNTLYGTTGKALFKHYGMNPYSIVEAGWELFVKTMKSAARGIRMTTLETLWKDAKSSTLNRAELWDINLQTKRFNQLYNDYRKHESRKEEYKQLMNDLLQQTVEYEKLKDTGISTFMLARIIAETGPIDRFDSYKCLVRYAGMNITRKESGKYQGHRKISKKGRALLRKVLYQSVFSTMTGEGQLYHEYYEQKKKDLNIVLKAKVAVMRKMLKMIYGVVNSAEVFNPERVFTMQLTG